MNREQVRQDFLEMIKPHVRIPDLSTISDESLLTDDLKVNSARFVDIILEAEDRFKISISDEEMERFERVGDAVDFICKKKIAA
ncbi:MAG TPA: phosphopantetheine-binding protein [Candidatus Acidoferrum sp.]|nr:phosphopantetheine-binding protein [Candidatus Acidoferrum sp.]